MCIFLKVFYHKRLHFHTMLQVFFNLAVKVIFIILLRIFYFLIMEVSFITGIKTLANASKNSSRVVLPNQKKSYLSVLRDIYTN